jgi:hypothetical protein
VVFFGWMQPLLHSTTLSPEVLKWQMTPHIVGYRRTPLLAFLDCAECRGPEKPRKKNKRMLFDYFNHPGGTGLMGAVCSTKLQGRTAELSRHAIAAPSTVGLRMQRG